MRIQLLLICFLGIIPFSQTSSQIVCEFANDSITICFNTTFQSSGGCMMDSVTTGLYFFSRIEDSMGVATSPSGQNFSGDDGTGMTASGNPNEFCLKIDIPSWYGVASLDGFERITFAIRNQPGSAFLTSSCVNNPFGYYIISDLQAPTQKVEDAAGTNIAIFFPTKRDTVCTDTTVGIESVIQNGEIEIYPNPFSYETNIRFTVIEQSAIDIYVTDLLGRHINSIEVNQSFGEQVLSWGGRDAAGNSVTNGLYLIHFQTQGQTISRKVSIIR